MPTARMGDQPTLAVRQLTTHGYFSPAWVEACASNNCIDYGPLFDFAPFISLLMLKKIAEKLDQDEHAHANADPLCIRFMS